MFHYLPQICWGEWEDPITQRQWEVHQEQQARLENHHCLVTRKINGQVAVDREVAVDLNRTIEASNSEGEMEDQILVDEHVETMLEVVRTLIVEMVTDLRGGIRKVRSIDLQAISIIDPRGL